MFPPGISGNIHSRPSVSGRAQVLAALDRMLSKECNQQAIFDALEKELQADPARFFRNTVVPLLPRSTREAPPPDENDDWKPLERHPPSTPPPGPCPPPAPMPPPLPPTPSMESSSGIPDLQPSVLSPPPSDILSFACYLLLFIPLSLPSSVHPLPPRLIHSRTLELPNFRTSPPVSLPNARPLQTPKRSHSRSGPALRSTSRPLQTLKRSNVSNAHTLAR